MTGVVTSWSIVCSIGVPTGVSTGGWFTGAAFTVTAVATVVCAPSSSVGVDAGLGSHVLAKHEAARGGGDAGGFDVGVTGEEV